MHKGISGAMDQRGTHGFGARLLLADRIALGVAAASLFASLGVVGLWWLSAGAQALPSPWLVALHMIVSPAIAGAAAWLAVRRMIGATLAPAVEQLGRLAARDFSTPTALGGRDGTNELAAALENCRSMLAEWHDAYELQQKAWLAETEERARADAACRSAAKVHAAVARLMGAAIGRLSSGDLSARINLDLPLHYAPVRSAFNAAMGRLEGAFEGMGAAGSRLQRQGREIEEASAVLQRRVTKLAERLDEDLAAVLSGGYGQDPERALRRLLYTMNGVQVATQRNAQAAAQFADLGRQVTLDAEHILMLARGFHDGDEGEPASGDSVAATLGLPLAGVPTTIGALALKVEQQPA